MRHRQAQRAQRGRGGDPGGHRARARTVVGEAAAAVVRPARAEGQAQRVFPHQPQHAGLVGSRQVEVEAGNFVPALADAGAELQVVAALLLGRQRDDEGRQPRLAQGDRQGAHEAGDREAASRLAAAQVQRQAASFRHVLAARQAQGVDRRATVAQHRALHAAAQRQAQGAGFAPGEIQAGAGRPGAKVATGRGTGAQARGRAAARKLRRPAFVERVSPAQTDIAGGARGRAYQQVRGRARRGLRRVALHRGAAGPALARCVDALAQREAAPAARATAARCMAEIGLQARFAGLGAARRGKVGRERTGGEAGAGCRVHPGVAVELGLRTRAGLHCPLLRQRRARQGKGTAHCAARGCMPPPPAPCHGTSSTSPLRRVMFCERSPPLRSRV